MEDEGRSVKGAYKFGKRIPLSLGPFPFFLFPVPFLARPPTFSSPAVFHSISTPASRTAAHGSRKGESYLLFIRALRRGTRDRRPDPILLPCSPAVLRGDLIDNRSSTLTFTLKTSNPGCRECVTPLNERKKKPKPNQTKKKKEIYKNDRKVTEQSQKSLYR